MRFHRCVALFAVAVAICAASILFALPANVRAADTKPTGRPTADRAEALGREVRPTLAERHDNLDEDDEIAALEAIRVALSEVGDGSTFIWHRRNGRLSGSVKPTSSFRDTNGRVCRHLVLLLATATRTGTIEGIACRAGNGRWELDG
jgi:surface antigen